MEYSLEGVMNLGNDVGCVTCHNAADPAGGLPLDGCIQALIDDGTYTAAGVDYAADVQNCVYYHLKNQAVDAGDPYFADATLGSGYRINTETSAYSMLLRNPYCGPNNCVADDYVETHPVRIFFGNDPANADYKSAAYSAIYSWIAAGGNNNKDADIVQP